MVSDTPLSEILGMSPAYAADRFGFPRWLKRPLTDERGRPFTASDGSEWEFDGADWIRVAGGV